MRLRSPFRTLASLVVTGVVGAGLAVVSTGGAPAVAAHPTCNQSVIEVSRPSTGTRIGYIGAAQGSSGTTLQPVRTVTSIDAALRVHTPSGTTSQNLAIVGRETTTSPYLGLSYAIYDDEYKGYLDDATPSLYPHLAHLVYTMGTAVGATPQNMSWRHPMVESAVWNVATNGELSVRWVNPDGRVAPGVGLVNSAVGESTMATAVKDSQWPASRLTLQPVCDQDVTLSAPTTGWAGGTAQLSASSTTSNPITYESRSPQVCTVAGTEVSYTAAGSCTVAAVQAAAGPWLRAERSATIAVSQDVLTDALSVTPASIVLGETAMATYTASALSARPQGTVVFSVDGRDLAPVTLAGGTASAAFTPDSVGDHEVVATFTSSILTVPSGTERTTVRVEQRVPDASLTLSEASTVTGQPSVATYQLSDSTYEPTGTVQFSLDGEAVGAPVRVEDGVATSGELRPQVGVHRVTAAYTPDRVQLTSTTHDATLEVRPAGTAATLATTADELVADVTVVAPGEGEPSGTVVFRVAGDEVGRSTLMAGRAVLAHHLGAGSHAVSAEYLGDASFLPSSASTSRDEPVITATTTGRTGDNGWHRGPVTVTFTCEATTAPLTTSCPEPVVVRGDTSGRTVSGTVHAADGGVATTSVRLAVDSVAPRVRIAGVRPGSTHFDRPAVKCVASDSRSGLASCRVTSTRKGERVVVRAVARDRAGNVSRARTSYVLSDLVIQGAQRVNGVWQVQRGRTYTVLARSSKTPLYVYAAPAGRSPHGSRIPFTRTGPKRWALPVGMRMAVSYSRDWRLGVILDGRLREVRVRVRG